MGTTTNSSCLLLALVLLSSFFHCYYAANHGRRHARPPRIAAVVVGSVVHSGSEATNAIPAGTLVAVRCHDGNGRTVFRKEAVTGRLGRFHVHLAQEASGRLRFVTSCSVHLQHQSNNAQPCAETATSSGLRPVASKSGSARVFSAGVFPVRAPDLCGRKGIFFPPVPLVPEPPNIGGVPIPPNPITPAPPSLVPPIFPTPSPPSILPPLVPQPPPSSIIPPLLPPLVSAPPPPPPPQLLPPLFPGVPPSSASKNRWAGSP
ncbi:RNA-binding protein 12-like [Panicum virgatum]|uniref:Uncharacterized protein n=1 Tax=Panicum virgatum TaxID=38727 RepID=A0A8T0NHQ6_PANVG|nr:RNA-binding protein 12-like [Panicum virgatum]KAG2549521.1 hypothetical protein PVAP13_9KG357700 [Panicum virgatum]